MPFTLAHPAIVLPLTYIPRKWISMTALVIGSVMPDAEAYLRMYSEKGLTHSWPGFLLFGVPFGMLLSFIFHDIVRNPLINNLPRFLQQRFSPLTEFNWNKRFVKNWVVVLISLIIGGASHFLWDNFSHFDGWLFNHYPALKGNIFLSDRELEIPYLIQYISTVIGIAVIIAFIVRLPAVKERRTRAVSPKFWILFLLISASIYIPRTIFFTENRPDDLLIAIISTCVWALFLVSLFFMKNKSEVRS